MSRDAAMRAPAAVPVAASRHGMKIAVHLEDPGAANFALPVLNAVQADGFEFDLFAEGACLGQVRQAGLIFAGVGANMPDLGSPAALVVGTSENPTSTAHRLVATARKAGILTIGLIDCRPNADRRFRGVAQDPLTHAPDWLLVPDEATRDAYQELGFASDRIAVVGHPHYDAVASATTDLEAVGRRAMRRRHFPSAPDDHLVVVFLAERSDGLDPADFHRSDDYSLTGWRDDDRRTHVVLQEVLDAFRRLDDPLHTVLRLHPKNAAAEFAAYGDRIGQMSRAEPALEMVYGADLVVGMSTMLLAEAALVGTPAVSVLPRAGERRWLPPVVGAQLPCVWERDLIAPALRQALAQGHPVVHQEPGAALRAASAIREITADAADEAGAC